ncbi:MAG: archaeosortase/exosortase family protein [Bacteroidales bacterium]|nr:archaeosortase/exosortase family protein [Bacteroidales bacterium]
MAERLKKIKQFIKKHQLVVLKDVGLFVIITLLIHFVWRFWARGFDYAPIHNFMYDLMDVMAAEVYRESAAIISGLYDVVRIDDKMHIYFPNNSMMYVNAGCSGLKQILQYALLIFLFPGPWIKKLWYIPLGIIIIHITNVLRVVGLGMVMNYRPQYWDFSHDFIFRPLFYVVIFVLWVIWVEKLKE